MNNNTNTITNKIKCNYIIINNDKTNHNFTQKDNSKSSYDEAVNIMYIPVMCSNCNMIARKKIDGNYLLYGKNGGCDGKK